MSDNDMDERVRLTVEQAMELLEVRDGEVHTFVNPAAGVLIGADWRLETVRAFFEKNGVELAGDEATSMGHGIASIERHVVFFATKKDAKRQVAS